MKKKMMAIACLSFSAMFAFGACGVGDGGGTTGSSSGGKKETGYLQVDPLPLSELGEGFNTAYLPVKGKAGGIKERSGSIDVAILFEGTEAGWQAVGDEYSRLHRGQVVVNLEPNLNAENYPEKLKNEFTAIDDTDWDIVQGNLAPSGDKSAYLVDIYNYVLTANGYAGGETWSSVLKEDAYVSDKSSSAQSSTHILNTEGLQTAWFVNDDAFNAAVAKGYAVTDVNGNPAKPKTWNDLLSLCDYMQEAGYPHPLGISLSNDSITASQFTWLLRVYGDYYYRPLYQNILHNSSTLKVDLTDPDIESDAEFVRSYPKLLNTILGYDNGKNPYYQGAKSDRFHEFIGNLGKMWEYMPLNAHSTTPAQMRVKFQTQSEDKESPQIMLDYAGTGLAYKKSAAIRVDFFDYPVMESDFVPKDTLLRDVGGNGGYLSVIRHGAGDDQTELSVDFLKFFMSPYGQTVYYNALSKAGIAPKGLTLVDNSLVCVPQEWQDFFNTTKISFTGLSDSNPFISWMIRGMSGVKSTEDKSVDLWKKYFQGTLTSGDPIVYFGNQWDSALMAGWKEFCEDPSTGAYYSFDIYKTEHRDHNGTKL